jgi:formamidopyrimidine-DNA glycosylase
MMCRIFGHGTLNHKIWAKGKYGYYPSRGSDKFTIRYNIYEGSICGRCGKIISKKKIASQLTLQNAELFMKNHY